MVRLRDYQSEALDRIGDGLARHRRTLAVMATGLGKTTVFAEFVRRRPGRALVIAHREELILQAAERVEAMTGEECGIEMAEASVHEGRNLLPPRVVVSSVQTLSRPRRLGRFRPDSFESLVIDEAHHATASTYRAVLDYFVSADVLGVTATPVRSDKARLGTVFPHVACDLGIPWAVPQGWLVPVRQRVVKVDGLDFRTVRTTAGDWSPAGLEEILAEEGPLHAIARPTLELSAGGPTLVFCAGVRQAEKLCEVLVRYREGCASWLCGETPRDERRGIIDRYKAGETSILVNVGVLTEGFDAPSTAFVVMARPTKSLGLYCQMLGRGTRALPGVVDGLPDADARRRAIEASRKPFMTVLDFVGSTADLDPRQMTAADVVGADESEETKRRAKEILADRHAGTPVQQILDLAREQLDAEREFIAEEAIRKRIRADAASYRVEESGTIGVGANQILPHMQEPATRGQRGLLKHLGVPWRMTEGISKRQAGAMISSIRARQQQGVAS